MALLTQIEVAIRQQGPLPLRQLARQLAISEAALQPMLELLVRRGRLATRRADFRSRTSTPTVYYELGPGELLPVRMVGVTNAA